MNDDTRLAIGGNNPPPYETAKLQAEEALEAFQPRKQEFLAAIGRINIRNRGDAEDATNPIGLAGDFLKLVEGKREEVITPYRQSVNAVNAVFANFTEDLVEARKVGTGKIQKYQNDVRELARKQQEEQAALMKPPEPQPGPEQNQLSEIPGQLPAAEASPEPVPALKPKQLRGTFGKKVVTRAPKKAVLVDLSKVPAFIMESQQVKSAIEAVATSFLKQFPNPDGFKIVTNESVNVQ